MCTICPYDWQITVAWDSNSLLIWQNTWGQKIVVKWFHWRGGIKNPLERESSCLAAFGCGKFMMNKCLPFSELVVEEELFSGHFLYIFICKNYSQNIDLLSGHPINRSTLLASTSVREGPKSLLKQDISLFQLRVTLTDWNNCVTPWGKKRRI